MLPFLGQTLVFFGGTLLIWAVDRSRRARTQGEEDDAPSPFTIVLLCFLLNVACLPYYFGRTRRSFYGFTLGVFFMLALLMLSVATNVALRLVHPT